MLKALFMYFHLAFILKRAEFMLVIWNEMCYVNKVDIDVFNLTKCRKHSSTLILKQVSAASPSPVIKNPSFSSPQVVPGGNEPPHGSRGLALHGRILRQELHWLSQHLLTQEPLGDGHVSLTHQPTVFSRRDNQTLAGIVSLSRIDETLISKMWSDSLLLLL